MKVQRQTLLLAVAFALSACGGDFGDTGDGNGGSNSTGDVRLVNASQTEFLELYDGNTALTAGVAQNAVSTYAKVSDGTRSLTVRAPASTTSLASANATVVRDDHHAVLAYTAFNAAATTVTTVVLPEDEAAPAANVAKLRVFNAATAAGQPVDVHVVTSTCAALADAQATPTVASVAGLQSGYATVTASATPYRVCVTDAGDPADVRLDVRLLLPSLRIVTLALVQSGNGMRAVTLEQQGAVLPVSPAASAP